MFDSIFNLIILLIPLSIFIGRVIVQARRKHAPPPVPPRIIPVEREEDIPHWERAVRFKAPDARAVPKPVKARKTQAALKPLLQKEPLAAKADMSQPPFFAAKTPAVRADAGIVSRGTGPVMMNHLSPLQQAVVMAEILGTPKGMV